MATHWVRQYNEFSIVYQPGEFLKQRPKFHPKETSKTSNNWVVYDVLYRSIDRNQRPYNIVYAFS